ncbi:helix-turn-helix domain-containing protein [Massilia sp. W12]|uniref:TetR/AcrR family transcriptional regulator n=1 Tax=Massilia sp. W12 TaxID=3126507 RepID=UPI0030CFEC9D
MNSTANSTNQPGSAVVQTPLELAPLPVRFTLAQFRAALPIDEHNIWGYLLERNSERIGVKRREVARDNLQKIIQATFRLANTVGFRTMTLRDLCRETGLSMGGLYGYIENKDQLANMIEDMVRHVTELLPGWFKHVAMPLDEIEGLLRAHVYLSEIFQPWAYFVFLESRTLQSEQRDIAKGSELNVQNHLASLLKTTGRFGHEETQLLAAHCMSLVQDWHLKRWKFGSVNVDADAFADSVVQFVRSYVRGMREDSSEEDARLRQLAA